METPVIELKSAAVCSRNRRGYRVVLRNVDLEVYPYEMVYLIGKVGSGKSTLLKTLYGEIPLSAGRGSIVGYDLNMLKQKHIPFLRRKLGMVFQDFQLLDDRSVYENLRFVLQATGWKNEAAIHARIIEILEMVGLGRKIHTLPYKLSGGEQQCLAIGRAFLNHPQVILADEPTGNLDPQSYDKIMNLFADITATGCSVLIATHNIAVIERFPARTIRFNDGTIEEIDIVSILGLENIQDSSFETTGSQVETDFGIPVRDTLGMQEHSPAFSGIPYEKITEDGYDEFSHSRDPHAGENAW